SAAWVRPVCGPKASPSPPGGGLNRTAGFPWPSPLGAWTRPSNRGRCLPSCVTPSVERRGGGIGILTDCPSPTPRGLGLGPTNPGRMNLPHEPLGFRRAVFSPAGPLLVPASSLPPRPAVLPVRLHPVAECSPTARRFPGAPAASGAGLSPVELSAQDRLTSELLRTLSRMAASKPTSWLSARPHILSHSARTPGP